MINTQKTEFEQLIDGIFYLAPGELQKSHTAPMNISKNSKLTFIQVQVPGFEKKEISVVLSKNILTITGTILEEEAELENSFEYSTKQYEIYPFKNVIKLSDEIINGDFSIDLAGGILTITCKMSKVVQNEIRILN